ncbi:hypothetical protein, partial [Janthinobacterium sp.]|uniref:hypothetical protein n=1 Tax=Janthinobacterium sp. TaxID=1871054 RepID=UPI00293D8E08
VLSGLVSCCFHRVLATWRMTHEMLCACGKSGSTRNALPGVNEQLLLPPPTSSSRSLQHHNIALPVKRKPARDLSASNWVYQFCCCTFVRFEKGPKWALLLRRIRTFCCAVDKTNKQQNQTKKQFCAGPKIPAAAATIHLCKLATTFWSRRPLADRRQKYMRLRLQFSFGLEIVGGSFA